jgi:hypothetical protein
MVLWKLKETHTHTHTHTYTCRKPGLLQSLTKAQKGVCHTVALPFTLKSILRQKNNYGKFKYFTMQKYNLQKKNPLKETKILQDITTLWLISSFNTSQNNIFQKSSVKTTFCQSASVNTPLPSSFTFVAEPCGCCWTGCQTDIPEVHSGPFNIHPLDASSIIIKFYIQF